MKIGIYGSLTNNLSLILLEKIVTIFKKKSIKYYIHEKCKKKLDLKTLNFLKKSNFIFFENLDNSYNFLIVIGGDGTIIDSAQIAYKTQIPIIGINTGRLGFLSTISKNDNLIEKIEKIENNDYTISKRSLLSIEGLQDKKHFFCLNEIFITGIDRIMINIEAHINNHSITSYWADGLLLSTPTGSTAYSLSLGGSIISPDSKVFNMIPIAPHNLSTRPLIIPDNNIVSFKVKSRETSFLVFLDSRKFEVKNTTTIKVKKEKFNLNLVALEKEKEFYTKINTKLFWGYDPRN